MDTIQNNNFFPRESQRQINSNTDNNNNKLNQVEKNEIKTNRNIPYFFLNDYLSDAVLKFEQNEIPFHKVIISSASDFFFDYFKTLKNPYEKIEVNLPEYIKSSLSGEVDKKEIIENIFNYCYHNQDIKAIEENITKNNCFNYVEMSHCLQIQSLKENLEKIIIKNFLNEDNIVKLCEESILFEMKEVHKQCKENIIKSLGKIKNVTKEMTRLNYDTFKDIISSDKIDAENEKEICDIVIEYIKFRREIPEEIKENINNTTKNINNINVEVKENEEKKEQLEENKEQNEENKEQNEENKEQNEENKENQNENLNTEEKKEENLEQKNNEIKENNENNPYNIWKRHIEEIKNKLIKRRLTPEEERNLVSCIRLSFLSHSDLILLNNEPLLDNFKDLIMQGLSARLDTYENAEEKNMIINLKPRNYLRKKEKNMNNKNDFEYNITNDNEIQNINRQKSRRDQENEKLDNINKFNDRRNFAYSQQVKNNNYNQNFFEENNSTNNQLNMNTNNEINKYEKDFKEYNDNNNMNFNESNSNYLEAENYNNEYINSTNRKNKIQNQNNKPNIQLPIQYSPKNNIQNMNKRNINSMNPLIFKYNYDFDENGALYYIGTLGKKYIYRNPHELKLVKAFASSISKGEISDFVGRNLVNLRTENEELSYFGVDLGLNRRLIPSAYSLRNRNSSTHVLLCWNLEGSNDKINFEVLDTRIFASENYEINKKLGSERNLLIQPGCTSTWGISRKIREKFPEGFRYFLIKQIDKNSNGSYNLTNSGFEIYGEGIGDGWLFD